MVRASKQPPDPSTYADPSKLPKRGGPDRIFWMTMVYKCVSCHHEDIFYLEQGCEGPVGNELQAVTTADHPMGPGHPTTMQFTGMGRAVVPVPMNVAGCPNCNKKNVHRVHVRWSDDATLFPPKRVIGEPDFCHFLYPTAALKKRLKTKSLDCGYPVTVPTSQAGTNG